MAGGRGSKELDCIVFLLSNYISIIFTPNQGSRITVPDRERKQDRLRGSYERARGSMPYTSAAGGSLKWTSSILTQHFTLFPSPTI